MVGGATAAVTKLRTVAAGVAVVIAAAVCAWGLAFPQNSLADTLIRAVADCAAVVTLGLAVVPMFDVDRYRRELADRAARPLILASAVWAVAEVVRLVRLGRTGRGGVGGAGRRAHRRLEFATVTTAGRSGLVCAAAAAVVAVVATVASRMPWNRPWRGVGGCGGGRSDRAQPGRAPVGEPGRRPRGRRARTGRGAVVRRAGGAGPGRRASRAVGPRAAPLLAAVPVLRGGAGGVRSGGARSSRCTPPPICHDRLRPAVVGQDRVHGGADGPGVAQSQLVAARRTLAPRDRGRVAAAVARSSWRGWPWR